MRPLVLLAALALLLLASGAAAQGPPGLGEGKPSFSADLTDETVEATVQSAELGSLVWFYAPWCAHCKAMAAAYEMVAHAFKRDARVVVAKVDATVHTAVKNKFEVTEFPKILWFPGKQNQPGEPEAFTGARTAERLVDFINEKSGLATHLRGAVTPPGLTDAAKQRAMKRMQGGGGGAGGGGTGSPSARSPPQTSRNPNDEHDEL